MAEITKQQAATVGHPHVTSITARTLIVVELAMSALELEILGTIVQNARSEGNLSDTEMLVAADFIGALETVR